MEDALAVPPSLRDRVTHVVARFLKIEPHAIDPAAPLTLYGLDSLTSMELAAALEDEFGRTFPEWLIVDTRDLDAIVRVLDEDAAAPAISPADEMRADAELPADIRPPAGGVVMDPPDEVLLTGVTGFLGGFLLRTLMEDTNAHVHCLVRGEPRDGRARVVRNLERYGLWQPAFTDRLSIICGDLTRPGFGLPPPVHAMLSARVSAIYHSGAKVNWALPYPALREANVIATRELLRLACAVRPKVFHFVSSLSVCYAVGGPASVDEDADMLAHVGQLPLGYAQSKAVAESLVRQAAARGLPVCIHRPSFITGDSTTGASNVDDLIAALIKGCIQMGAAPDLDWTMDTAPVEHVARAIVRLPGRVKPGLRPFHLTSHRPRHWRECVLWMNLLGYPCRLMAYADWLRQFDRDSQSPDHALHRLRSFFLRREFDEGTAPELYQDGRRSAVDSTRTRAAEGLIGLRCPRLDASLLDRYFSDYVARGFLPASDAAGWKTGAPDAAAADESGHRSANREPDLGPRGLPIYDDPRRIEDLLRRHLADPSLEVRVVQLLGSGSEHSIIGELTAWRHGQRVGLFHCRLTFEQQGTHRQLDVMAKAKAPDTDVITVGETLARMLGAPLAEALHEFREEIGIRRSHLRELAVYEQADVRARQFMPACYGTWQSRGPAETVEGSDRQSEWGLLLERLENMALMDASDDPARWSRRHIDSAIDGLAELHASWIPRVPEIEHEPWMGHVPSLERRVAMRPLWTALSNQAAPAFAEWTGDRLDHIHRELIDTIEDWWLALDASPRTLIHHDFNPRNIALRHHEGGFRLCAYDWELATIGAPQRDLAELLCFVLPTDVLAEDAARFIEHHRQALSVAIDRPIDRGMWVAGFRSALADLLIDRLAFYAMIHRVRPQAFLPRVVHTWLRLWTTIHHAPKRRQHRPPVEKIALIESSVRDDPSAFSDVGDAASRSASSKRSLTTAQETAK